MPAEKAQKKATMTDVAKRAGVTIGTVSHVINGTAPISKATTAKVLRAIKELSYTPNKSAVALRTSQTKTIGIMVPDVTNIFYSVISEQFAKCARKDGYTVFVFNYGYDHETEAQGLSDFASQNVDAILLWNGYDDEDILAGYLASPWNPPLILNERTHQGFFSIKSDNASIVEQVVDMLYEKGYRDIGFVAETIVLENLYDRYLGYLRGMRKNGLVPDKRHIHIQKNMLIDNMSRGYNLFKEFIQKNGAQSLPEVYVVASDLLSMGIMRAFQEAGLRIPEDIAIVGFDNAVFCDYLCPPLTTVDQDKEAIGRIVWEKTKQIINGEEPSNDMIIDQKIIMRSSC